MARPIIYYRNSTGGSNLRDTELSINQGLQGTEMVYIQNMDVYKEGGFQAQLGNVQLNTGVSDATAVIGIGEYITAAGTFIIYQKASGNAYVIPLAGGAEPAAIKTGLNASAQVTYIQFNGKVIAFNGQNQPWSWNGTASADLTGTPAAWASSKPTTAATLRGGRILAPVGSTIYYCALGNELDWTTAADAGMLSNLFNDSTAITCLKEYGDTIAIHTNKPSVMLLTGTSPATYTVQRVASNRACKSKLGSCTVDDKQYFYCGDAILPLYTTELGVIKVNRDNDVSRKIKPFLTGTDSELALLPVDPNQYGQSILLPYDAKNQMIGYFKSLGSTVFDVAAIYNIDLNAWVFRKATPVTCAARVGDYIITGTPDGKILKEFIGTECVGNVFLKRVLTPYLDFGSPETQKQLTRIFAVFKTTTNLGITMGVTTDYEGGVKRTETLQYPLVNSSYGTASYGVSSYSSSQIIPYRAPINLQAKSFQLDLQASQYNMDFRLLYFAFEVDGLDAY